MKIVNFSLHSLLKFSILRRHGFNISEKEINDCIQYPDNLSSGFNNRKIAQKIIDEKHSIRVIFEETENEIIIITFYPVRSGRYE
ncbi:MAG: DUF4258 domain-containing protein [Bacteroidetes bacterium]|nr:MAG: DUF4258 domain-containing protein [Bacteroidota bacterium]